jgi:hypothetical protein
MSDFLVVIGPDPHYKGREALCLVSRLSVSTVYPVWAVESDGKYWRCSDEHPDAQIIAFQIVDYRGITFTCSIEEAKKLIGNEELAALRIPESEKRRIGFIQDLPAGDGRSPARSQV